MRRFQLLLLRKPRQRLLPLLLQLRSHSCNRTRSGIQLVWHWRRIIPASLASRRVSRSASSGCRDRAQTLRFNVTVCSIEQFCSVPGCGFDYAILGMNIMGVCKLKAPANPPSAEVRMVKRGIVMAKVIEFYVPTILRKPLKGSWRRQRGKIIEFCTQARKSA